MALPAEQTEERIDELIAGSDRRFQAVIRRAVEAAKDESDLRFLEQLLEQGRIQDAADEAARIIGEAIADEYANSYTLAGQAGAAFLAAAVGKSISFNVVSPESVLILQTSRTRIVDEYVRQQREATTEALGGAARRDESTRQTARSVQGSIGLNRRNVQAVENYRRLLESGTTEALTRDLRDRRFDGTVRRAAREGRVLTQAQIDRMVERYAARLERHRRQVIARTESLSAVNAGNNEILRQAVEAGFIDPSQIEREWISREDARVRASHVHLNGMVRGFDETFPGQNGELRFPGDPAAPPSETINCRCVLVTRIGTPRDGSNAGL